MQCLGQPSCTVSNTFVDPCSGFGKFLTANVECVRLDVPVASPRPNPSATPAAEYSVNATQVDYTVVRRNFVLSCPVGYGAGISSIIAADYGTGSGCSINSAGLIKHLSARCVGYRQCSFLVYFRSLGLLSEPCTGQVKRLTASALCQENIDIGFSEGSFVDAVSAQNVVDTLSSSSQSNSISSSSSPSSPAVSPLMIVAFVVGAVGLVAAVVGAVIVVRVRRSGMPGVALAALPQSSESQMTVVRL